jgi:hypothetical protein
VISAHRPIPSRTIAGAASGLLLAASMLLSMAGCDTIAQDIDLFTKNLFPPSPSEAAEMMIDPNDPDRRRAGVTWIANSPFGGAEAYLRQYRLMVETERDAIALAMAIRALARHGESDDATLIARQLTHPNQYVRWEAARGLQRLHNPAVVTDLLEVIRNPEELSDIRVAAAHALGQYPQDRVFQALIGALDARELAVNRTAAQSLSTLTGRDLGDDARDWLRWYNSVAPDERFADMREYRFTTYTRDETLLERLAFWHSPTFEQPAPPAGLAHADLRRTYDDGRNGE